ncbi:major facilitator superfamily domain-containing protein 6 isoform X1 [Vespa crabro]|uniref:major facilitator superfamily domain-containing protein 6 isoform X1 n=2 Tax=Vespa crabro TaxID=7445 RepID=UPI001F01374F|nr:major facilitator superfamily domain-containing protein 6 isoform X1 [Vespa crabro]XP_046815966.1 major facilitator superfamily domain-containing protein 6 isoform X1 [Vespa crabro]XP_046815967.1 major facilitator superfamily domain-containing protein 6 isoform X1 [Vespa crabro]
MFDNIDKNLFFIKAHYFLFNAATGPVVPFLPTIAKQLGFSGTLVGTIFTILPISGLIAKPLFGGLADKFNLSKTFFLIFQVLLTISLFSIHFIPQFRTSANITLTCDGDLFLEVCSKKGFSDEAMQGVITTEETTDNPTCQLFCKASQRAYEELCLWNPLYCTKNNSNISLNETFDFIATINMYKDLPEKNCTNLRVSNVTFSYGNIHRPACKKLLKTSCIASCQHPALNELLHESDNYDISPTDFTYQFHFFLWTTIVSWICMAVVVSIADSICFNLLGNERRKDYGKQKMWGSIGFGIFGISAGYLVDIFSEGQFQKDYTCIFFMMLVFMILDIIMSARLKKKNPECSEEPSMLRELLTVTKEPNIWIFGWWCIGAGMCTGVIWNFLLWHTENVATFTQTKWIKTLQGLLIGTQCFLAEMPFNFLSGSILKKFGHINIMSLVLLIYSIRFMTYSLISNPWLFLPLEILHGPSYGLCWPTMVSYGDKVTPPGTQSTIQGFIGSIFEGIGVSSGTLLCGWIMDVYGGVEAFRIFSVGALIWLSIFWFMQLLLRKIYSTQGHNHLASYANPDDAILMTISQELQTY